MSSMDLCICLQKHFLPKYQIILAALGILMACEVNSIFKIQKEGKGLKKREHIACKRKHVMKGEKRTIKLLKCCRMMHTLNFNASNH